MNLKLKHVMAAYEAMKKRAQKMFQEGNIDKTISYIGSATILSSQIMWKYGDDEIESLLENVSESISKLQTEFVPNKNKVVFYDSFGITYILAIQYMKALVETGNEILYIYEERDQQHKAIVPVIDLLRNYKNVTIEIVVSNEERIAKFQRIYDLITTFNPSRLYTHIGVYSAVIPVLYSLPKEIIKYHINLGDHLFWLGTKAIDFTYEFRSFGAVVSHEKRGLRKEQLLLLPYYPITENKTFLGFPDACKGKVVIFSGGDFYKTIDKDNSYWELTKTLLTENPNAIVLFATKLTNDKGPRLLEQFISDNGFEDRLLSIGFRPDINEVFAHCDIFMGTSPMSGGLMSQYAAVNAKPILQYYPPERFPDNETESVICFHHKMSISHTDKRAFLDEAKRLIDDSAYRQMVGAKIKSCMITEEEFNALFAKSLETNTTPVEIEELKVNYDALTNWWLEIDNKGYFDASTFIYAVLGNKGIFEVPTVVVSMLYKRLITDKVLSLKWYQSKFIKNSKKSHA